ncbi:unnamed protein product [Hyaloperonospora brassicae]|uniref:Uncharacterized protein n=1 Tax=Hyaloperonospora brassicae TaxID=162125 RepID=A0AAV0SZD0_HYABA|nr:unnamed protein product [Hyaloperonospora brassicae]
MVLQFVRRSVQQLFSHSATCAASHRTTVSAASTCVSSTASSVAPASAYAAGRARPQPQHIKADPTGVVAGVVAGVAIVGAFVGVGKMWWDASSLRGASEPEAVQTISQKELGLFLEELTAAVKELFNKVPVLEDALRAYMKENGHELSDAEFKQAVLSQLYQMMEAIETQVIEKRKWNPASLESALEMFAQDAEVLRLQGELNKLMQTVFPASTPVEVPEDLTPDRTLVILKVMVAGMEKAMSDMLAHARAEGISDVVGAMEAFQHLYMEHVEQMTQAQMKLHGISQEVFTAALQKHHTENEQFREQVEQIYAQQAKAFEKMGLPIEMQ